MTPALTIILVLLLTMAAFVWGRRRYEVIAICALFAATALGLVPYSQVFLGFGEPAVITVICVMIISKAIARTGLIDLAARQWMEKPQHFVVHLGGLCLTTLLLSAFINNIGAMAIVLPIALELAERHKRPPSLVLMPIALSAALGGLTTLIGTPANIIISQFREHTLGSAFSFFNFSLVGLPIAILGLLFLVFIGWRLLPKDRQGSHADLTLAIEDYITEIRLGDDESQPIQTVTELEEKLPDEAQLLGIIRNNHRYFSLKKNETLEANDVLVLEGAPDAIKEVMHMLQATLHGSHSSDQLLNDDIILLEGVVGQSSPIENQTPKSLGLRSRYQTVVLAISRQGKTIRTRISKTRIKVGDVLLLQGPSETIKQTAASLGLLPLQGRDLSSLSNPKILLPVAFFIMAIVVASLGFAPVQITFSAAIVLMVLFRAIPTRLLYEGVDWPIIILLGAMIPLGTALQTNGGTALISHALFNSIEHLPNWALLSLIMFITMTLSDFMNNAATAIIMAPIAIAVATQLGVNPDAFLMSVAIGASCAFITPIGHQNNLLIMGPGGYRFTDYLRAGIPLELIVLVAGTPLLLWAWPL